MKASSPLAMGDSIIKGEKPTLLIVEDNEDVQWMIKNLLQDDYHCQVANHGVEAVDFLKTAKNHTLPSLILSDIMMPRMDGYELLDQLKSNQAWQQIPVVLLTARAEMEDKLRALRLGVDDYLIKPFFSGRVKSPNRESSGSITEGENLLLKRRKMRSILSLKRLKEQIKYGCRIWKKSPKMLWIKKLPFQPLTWQVKLP